MIDFDISRYGPVCQALLADAEPTEIGPGAPRGGHRDQLAALDAATLFSGQPVVDQAMAACCESALWLLHDYLDESHRISQEIHTPTGSYWHGIMHRREPDFSNSKYWFRKVGEHPVFDALTGAARSLATAQPSDPSASFLAAQESWDAAAFVDLCEAVTRGRANHLALCQAVAAAEWKLLFDYCYRSALGQP